MEKDWWNVLPTQKYAPPYKIQWCLRSGNVRAKHDGTSEWIVSDCCVNAKYAFHIGYELLKREVRL